MTLSPQELPPRLSPLSASDARPVAPLSTNASDHSLHLVGQLTTLWTRVGLFRDVLAVAVAGLLALALTLASHPKTNAPDAASPGIEQLLKWPLNGTGSQ